MNNDNAHGTEIGKTEVNQTAKRTVAYLVPETVEAPLEGAASETPSRNVIDFRQRAKELRIKSTLAETAPTLESSKSLAFGMMYLGGEGVERDPAKAARLLENAAKGGSSIARHELARMHVEKIGVEYDPEFAIALLQRASDEGHLPSSVYLAELLVFGKHCEKQIEKGLELLYSAAAKNEPSAMYYLGTVYDKEPGYRNTFEAAYWYRRAAEYGHFKSQIRLACLYAIGQGVPMCLETSEAFLSVALETAHEQDPGYLLWQGELYMQHPQTEFLAQALVKAAADQHHRPAQRVLLQRGWRA